MMLGRQRPIGFPDVILCSCFRDAEDLVVVFEFHRHGNSLGRVGPRLGIKTQPARARA